VLAKVAKNEAELNTFEADMKMTPANSATAAGKNTRMAWQAVLKDGKQVGTLMNTKETDGPTGLVREVCVHDGVFSWTEVHDPHLGVIVTKNIPNASWREAVDPLKFRNLLDLKLVGTEVFDSQNMWVLEGTPKAENARRLSDIAKALYFVGQKDLVCHRIRVYDKDGNEVSDVQLTNIKLNGKLDPALFKYTPPDGVRVADFTQGPPNAGDAPHNKPTRTDAGGK